MVGKKRHRKKQKLLGNHQKAWLWGKHAVWETLRAAKWIPLEVVIAEDGLNAADKAWLSEYCRAHEVRLREVDSSELSTLVSAKDHQGIAARMPAFPWLVMDELLQTLPECPLLLILDRIQDPFNFGSILRSADLFGVDGIIVGEHAQCEMTSHVVRSSVGAVNYLNLCRVESLTDTIDRLTNAGTRIIAATEKGTQAPDQVNLVGNAAIIMGNEGVGIAPELLRRCTVECAIPQQGHVGSLNAAVAAGILMYEAHRQRMSRNPTEQM